jgi:hypothetical protein
MYQNMKKINIKGLLWKFRGKDTKFEEEKKKKDCWCQSGCLSMTSVI